MRILKWVLASVAFAALASCGGGGSCGNFATCSTSGGGGGTAGLATITVTSSVATIPSDGSAAATITATALNSGNNAISGATLTFSASAGTVVVGSATTDASGVATATVSAGTAAAGTTITVTVKSGAVSGKTTVDVISAQQTLSLTTSTPSIDSNGTQTATITALVLGASNNLLANVPVDFTASSGGLNPANPIMTGANGTAQVTLSTAGDPTNRAITVTATAGTSMNTIKVNVTGSTLIMTGPANVAETSTSTYSLTLADSGGAGIPSQAITISSADGNPLNGGAAAANAVVTTNASGQATFTMTASAAANDTLTATALNTTVGAVPTVATLPVTVSTNSFTFTTPAANATVGLSTTTVLDNQAVTIKWTSGAAPNGVSGANVTFSTTRGLFGSSNAGNPSPVTPGTVTQTVMTDANGNATVDISSTTAGPATITATGTGVSAQLPIVFVASTPTQMALQASPDTIETNGQSQISATLRDANNNLVAGQSVNFQLTDITGGNLSSGTAITNSQGVAQITYTASSTASSPNGVSITATVPLFPGVVVTPNPLTLTVGGQAVFLTLGTGTGLTSITNGTQFQLPYVVEAVDSNGQGIANLNITLAIQSVPYVNTNPLPNPEPNAYAMGTWVVNTADTEWIQAGGDGSSNSTPPTYCPNEDRNNNGVYTATDPGLDVGGLYPGSVAAVAPGTVVTDNTGSAPFNIVYPQDHAGWVAVVLTASTLVNGNQGSTSATFWLPVLAADVDNPKNPMPGQTSPYGILTTCPGVGQPN